MRKRITGASCLVAVAFLAGACGGSEVDADEALHEIEAPPPDTTAEALWTHVQEADYAQNWAPYPAASPRRGGWTAASAVTARRARTTSS